MKLRCRISARFQEREAELGLQDEGRGSHATTRKGTQTQRAWLSWGWQTRVEVLGSAAPMNKQVRTGRAKEGVTFWLGDLGLGHKPS